MKCVECVRIVSQCRADLPRFCEEYTIIVTFCSCITISQSRLRANLLSYTLSQGLEKHYLRCQISRISAATHVSPAGYFNFGGEEDEAEDAGAGGDPMENANFQGIPVVELVDPALENWVHHVPYILPQVLVVE